MTENPLSKMEIDYWYKALLVAGIVTMLVSLSVEMKGISNAGVQLMSLGAAFIGIGEWINHPLQTVVYPSGIMTGYPRKNYLLGNAFDVAGLLLIIFGIRAA